MRIVRIRSYSGLHFPAFGQNTDQNNPEYGQFLRSVLVHMNISTKNIFKDTQSYRKGLWINSQFDSIKRIFASSSKFQ